MSDDIIKRLREAIAAGPTPGHMECIDRTVFVLMHAGWRKGEELFKNRITLTVEHDRAECPVDEARATARFIAAASPENIAALLDRLDKAEREIERLREDAERLDSGLIRLVDRDEFGESVATVYSQVDLRAAIDAARAAEQGDERRER